jgi:hypothetical protein
VSGAPLRERTVSGMSDEMANVIKLFKDDPQTAARQKLHSLWEDMFARHGQTLTDPVAADSLRAAIAMMDGLLDGACATEVINEDQRDTLRAVMHVGLSAIDELQGPS